MTDLARAIAKGLKLAACCTLCTLTVQVTLCHGQPHSPSDRLLLSLNTARSAADGIKQACHSALASCGRLIRLSQTVGNEGQRLKPAVFHD